MRWDMWAWFTTQLRRFRHCSRLLLLSTGRSLELSCALSSLVFRAPREAATQPQAHESEQDLEPADRKHDAGERKKAFMVFVAVFILTYFLTWRR